MHLDFVLAFPMVWILANSDLWDPDSGEHAALRARRLS